MKLYTTKVLCKGCKAELVIQFNARSSFPPLEVQTQCGTCESYLSIQVKQGFFRRQIKTKVNMDAHSQKLLSILEERRNAKDHAV